MRKNRKINTKISEEDLAFMAATDEWEQDIKVKFTYEDKLLNEGAKQERERIKNLLNSDSQNIAAFKEKKPKFKILKENERFLILGIDVPRLVVELEKRNYFDLRFKNNILNWFNGNKPEVAIPMNTTASKFVSLVADIWDARPKHLMNSKEFVYSYIQESFLFNGRKLEISTIKQIMKPTSSNRVSSTDNTIPNYQDFTLNKTT